MEGALQNGDDGLDLIGSGGKPRRACGNGDHPISFHDGDKGPVAQWHGTRERGARFGIRFIIRLGCEESINAAYLRRHQQALETEAGQPPCPNVRSFDPETGVWVPFLSRGDKMGLHTLSGRERVFTR